jgi:hypothetical protein
VKQENILVITITTINSKIAVMVQGFDNSYVRFFFFFFTENYKSGDAVVGFISQWIVRVGCITSKIPNSFPVIWFQLLIRATDNV